MPQWHSTVETANRWLKTEALPVPESLVSSAGSIRLGRPDIIVSKLEYSFHFVSEKPRSLQNRNRKQCKHLFE